MRPGAPAVDARGDAMISVSPHARSLLKVIALLGAMHFGVIGTAALKAQQAPMPQRAARDMAVDAVREASLRFAIPEQWIWSVIRAESAGRTDAVSRAGAIGLMQVMPATYAQLRVQFGLGAYPFSVRDNIFAGTAYLRAMYDRYGNPGMFGAYNAGPGRWEQYLSGTRALSGETVAYVAKLAPGVSSAGTIDAPKLIQVAPRSPLAAPLFVTDNASLKRGTAASIARHEADNRTTGTPLTDLFIKRVGATNGIRSSNTNSDARSAEMPGSRVDAGADVARSGALFVRRQQNPTQP
jgi:hypothetical protein